MYFCAIIAFGEAVLVPVADRDCLKAFSSEKIIAWAYFKLAAMLYEVYGIASQNKINIVRFSFKHR